MLKDKDFLRKFSMLTISSLPFPDNMFQIVKMVLKKQPCLQWAQGYLVYIAYICRIDSIRSS